MEALIPKYFENKRIAVLGYGLEGRSSCRQILKFLPDAQLIICDSNAKLRNILSGENHPVNTRYFLGEDYLSGLEEADVIIKTPGISYKLIQHIPRERFVTQTGLFLEAYRDQVVGITGTKGKSTTASLLHHILHTAGRNTILAGNIGTPVFDVLDQIGRDTVVVVEMSSHQLEYTGISPHIAVLLNVFKEHLDHYAAFEDYLEAKLNIVRWQSRDDCLFFHQRDVPVPVGQINEESRQFSIGDTCGRSGALLYDGDAVVFDQINTCLPLPGVFSKSVLRGAHNKVNIAAAAGVSALLGVKAGDIVQGVADFRGLPHRLEYIGTYHGVHYYNDSIATIPEACMEALKALPETATLILGGFDRGLDYRELMQFLAASNVQNLLFTGDAGARMHAMTAGEEGFSGKNCLPASGFDEAVQLACRHTPAGKACLLSPAAASYDAFSDFRERGERFSTLVRQYNPD
ncbi:MAG: UDP-N-acetylmuramoyl-L-alanine--D-glutamate ligase [Bacteroidales bacterium]|nr:UDP-N-acetylmuramoyl-L-alanine--D-glutamate ligase [Bacteroidales bacterium]